MSREKLSRQTLQSAEWSAAGWSWCITHGFSVPPGTSDCGGGAANTCVLAGGEAIRDEWGDEEATGLGRDVSPSARPSSPESSAARKHLTFPQAWLIAAWWWVWGFVTACIIFGVVR